MRRAAFLDQDRVIKPEDQMPMWLRQRSSRQSISDIIAGYQEKSPEGILQSSPGLGVCADVPLPNDLVNGS